MKNYRLVLSIFLLAAFFLGAYTAFIYVYTECKFAPLPLLTEPSAAAPSAAWNAPDKQLFLHQVNTVRRAKKKETKYAGYELDLLPGQDGTLWVAHDESQLKRRVTLQDIFAALKNPQAKTWWLDLKTDLTSAELDEIINTAARFGIPKEHLFLETGPGPTAKLIKQKGLGLLLALTDGFDEDDNNPQKRRALNAKALKEWQEYQPHAVSASFGKYAYLRAYFPNMPKAIYYSATVRPSLKKTFMKRQMATDPSVRIFMLDEYTF